MQFVKRLFVFFIFTILVFVGCSQDSPVEVATQGELPLFGDAVTLTKSNGAVFSGRGRATIDGVLTRREWRSAARVGVEINVPEGGTTPGVLLVMNDAHNLYLALAFLRTFVDPGNTIGFEFDNDNDGIREEGDDVLLNNPSIGFRDIVRTMRPPCPPNALCGLLDTGFGGTTDGASAFLNNGVFTVYEFSHPLDSADDLNDFSLSGGDIVGFFGSLRLLASGNFGSDTRFPGFGFWQIRIAR